MEKTLVILAAGMGSRFGGLKQIEPVGPSGEFIVDYSIYDAMKAGFTKVVFIIKKEHYNDFVNTIGKRIGNKIKIEYAFQDPDMLPIKVDIKREKPWGTGHALYCAKEYIDGPFALISADDFYGPHSFEHLSSYLDNEIGISVIGYKIGETLSENGEVKRGVILAENNIITAIKESKVNKQGQIVTCSPLDGSDAFTLPLDGRASMLMFGFNLDIFPYLEEQLTIFLNTPGFEEKEFFLPTIVDDYIKKGMAKLIDTDDTWMGITYKEDLAYVKDKINNYIKEGIYKNNLWED